MNASTRHAASISGPSSAQTLVFADGFGCDQSMWQPVADRFGDHRTVLFDLVGFGASDTDCYDRERYSDLRSHAEDILELGRELQLQGSVFVGHSVSAMIGVLAAAADPEMFSKLVLVGPSPRYVDDDGYVGGFTRADIDELLDSLDSNYFAWSRTMAPMIAGNEERPELGERLASSFCSVDPEIAKHFARVTFLSDNRTDLTEVTTPTLILQCADDLIAPTSVGEYVHEHIADSTLVYLEARGHCPNLTEPEMTADAIRGFLG